jgi:hypothetical protein
MVMIVNDDDHQMKEFVRVMIGQLMNDQHHVMKRLQLQEKMDEIKQPQQPLLHVALLRDHGFDPLIVDVRVDL